jgi:hypothetical protein
MTKQQRSTQHPTGRRTLNPDCTNQTPERHTHTEPLWMTPARTLSGSPPSRDETTCEATHSAANDHTLACKGAARIAYCVADLPVPLLRGARSMRRRAKLAEFRLTPSFCLKRWISASKGGGRIYCLATEGLVF